MIKVREIKESDYIILRKIANDCKVLDLHTSYTYWVICKFFGDNSFIIEYDGIIVGYIMCLYCKDTLFIWQIGIIDNYRKKGLSQKLIKEVFKKAIDNKFNRVLITIDENNKDSFFAFSNFCNKNNLKMSNIGKIELKDFIDIDFYESEIIYEILF